MQAEFSICKRNFLYSRRIRHIQTEFDELRYKIVVLKDKNAIIGEHLNNYGLKIGKKIICNS